MKNHPGYLFLLLAITPVSLLFPAQDSRAILHEEIDLYTKLISEVKTLKNRGTVDPNSASAFIDDAGKMIQRADDRQKLLAFTAASRNFAVHASTQEAADQYLAIAEGILKDYLSFFPGLNFNPSPPAQILLYPTRADYLKFDGFSVMVSGHAISNRQKSTELVRRGNRYVIEENFSSTAKYYRLATFQEKTTHLVTHEICHIFTFDMINPTRGDLSELKPTRLLNEGLSEFFGTQQKAEVVRNRAASLMTGKDGAIILKDPEPIAQLILATEYPEKVQEFYAEGTLFTKWLMELPEGSKLVKSLLMTSPDRAESLLKMHQRSHSLPEDGFAAYDVFRKKILGEILAGLTAKEKAGILHDPKAMASMKLEELKSHAESGDASFQVALGTLYQKGAGVLKDFAEAAKWFRKAADQGNANGQYMLGSLYEKGRGVEKNLVTAYQWYEISSARGFAAARTRAQKIKGNLTPEQLAKATEMIKAFTPKDEGTPEEAEVDGEETEEATE